MNRKNTIEKVGEIIPGINFKRDSIKSIICIDENTRLQINQSTSKLLPCFNLFIKLLNMLKNNIIVQIVIELKLI